MKTNRLFTFIILFLFCIAAYWFYRPVSLIKHGERAIVAIVPSYNNSEWYEKNLKSIFDQKYTNYRVVYIDDCSQDGTAELVEHYIQKSGNAHRCTLIKNSERKGALYNLYHAIHACNDQEIVATIDGDDWLEGTDVFSKLNTAYTNPNVWLTYGQYKVIPDETIGQCRPMPQQIIDQNSYRKAPWITTHLRTFYAGLFKKISLKDLHHTGSFFEVTWDQAFMFPMLEMAHGRIAYIDTVIYNYNQLTPINDYKVRLPKVLACERLIRSRTPYQPLAYNQPFIQA